MPSLPNIWLRMLLERIHQHRAGKRVNERKRMAFRLQNSLLGLSPTAAFLASLADPPTTGVRSVWNLEYPTEKWKEKRVGQSLLQKCPTDHTEMFCYHRTPEGDSFHAVLTSTFYLKGENIFPVCSFFFWILSEISHRLAYCASDVSIRHASRSELDCTLTI